MSNKKELLYESVHIGDVFGELTVMAEDFEREQLDVIKHPNGRHFKYFKCQCSCGNITTVQVYRLLDGGTRSCGHIRKELAKPQYKDLTNQKFGHLSALHIDNTKPYGANKHVYWECECDICGNHKSIRSSDLLSGIVVDCGCRRWKRQSQGSSIDLTGMRFGHLTVLERDWSQFQEGGGKAAYWKCKCELCGRIESNSREMLKDYGKDRCKICSGISIGEQKIVDILTEHSISFIHDKPYLGLKSLDGGVLRFDFRINQDSDCDYIIEFDGEQHFKPVPMYDSSLSFEKRKQRDQLKNDWCTKHNIPMIRIPYTRLRKLCIEDLLLSTTKFLVNTSICQNNEKSNILKEDKQAKEIAENLT